MSPPTVKIVLSYEERRALEELSAAELRRPDDMLRWLLRKELERRRKKDNDAVMTFGETHGAVAAIAG